MSTGTTHRQNTYGLTPSVEAALLEHQGGCCGICKSKRDLVVDHCHTSGRIRGFLCKACNVNLGRIGDTVDKVRAALAYLLRAEPGGEICQVIEGAGGSHVMPHLPTPLTSIRVPQDEYDKWREKASSLGISVSQFIRDSCNDELQRFLDFNGITAAEFSAMDEDQIAALNEPPSD